MVVGQQMVPSHCPSSNISYAYEQPTKQQNDMCTLCRLRSAWTSVQSDQFSMSTRRTLRSLATQQRLIRLGGYPCWSDFSLRAHSFRWLCHALAQLWKKNNRPITVEPTGAVAKLQERPACVQKVVGSIPGQVIPKTFKMVLAALSIALRIETAELVGPAVSV